MKKPVFYAIWGVVTALQIALVTGAVILSRLAYTRGGVNHHVAFRKRQYNALIFTPGNVLIMQIVLAVVAVGMAWLLIRAIRRGGGVKILLAGLCILLDGALIFELASPAFRAIPIYPYAVLVTAVMFALELLVLICRRAVK